MYSLNRWLVSGNPRSNDSRLVRKGLRFLAVVAITTFGWLASSLSSWGWEGNEPESPEVIEPFELTDFAGVPWRLEAELGTPLVVVFVGVECPIVNLSIETLAKHQAEYGERVSFVLIDSNQQDTLLEMEQFAKRHQLTVPLLKDPGNRIADLFEAERTPEVVLLDSTRRVRYRGQIDDRYTYGLQRVAAQSEFLKDAIDKVLAGEEPEVAQTESVGCHIGRKLEPREDSVVTYCGQIAAILNEHCVRCHRAGEIGPFALDSYEEVVGWAEMIAEVVEDQRMPPWHASADHGVFSNDARLPQEVKRAIFDWVAAGAPYGDESQLPEPPQFIEGWQIDEPDLVVSMSEIPVELPATGEIPYRYFEVDPGFTEDRWIQQAECRPGNRAVVHHIIVAINPPGEDDKELRSELGEWLTATAPGALPLRLPEGYAKRIPAGSKLVFQMHYTTNGRPATDLSQVGFVFADPASVKHEVVTRQAAEGRFQIPPYADNHRVDAWHRFERDSVVTTFFPHMHLRGKAFRYVAHYPDGREEILLDIPKYDFNWQNAYVLAEPLRVPAGTNLQCIAHFDNSENNFSNPNPAIEVSWGDQTWQEMMIGYFDMYVDQPSEEEAPAADK